MTFSGKESRLQFSNGKNSDLPINDKYRGGQH